MEDVAVPSLSPASVGPVPVQGAGCGVGVNPCLSLGQRSKSTSVPEQGAVAQFPLGLTGKMSDMLKVALGFMQSQWCLRQLGDFRVFSKLCWTENSFGKCLRSSVKFRWIQGDGNG